MTFYLATSGASSAIITTMITACVTILGWFVAQQLTLAREARNRRLETLLKHYQRQIEEFYGPLFNNINQIFVTNSVHQKISDGLKEETAGQVKEFYHEARYSPLHAEMMQIIKTKLYLIDGSEMPKSFGDYLEHAIQERDQWEIYKQLSIDTTFLPGRPWPPEFFDNVQSGLERAMRNYEACIGELKAPKGVPVVTEASMRGTFRP
jgi:hypothetical protein